MKKVTSDFAILDIKSGRASLSKMLGGYPECMYPIDKPIPVTIKGFISHQWGADDGVSREFAIDVQEVKIKGLNK